jgi:hypothetical protein
MSGFFLQCCSRRDVVEPAATASAAAMNALVLSQGSQAPLRGFDQLVEGPWPISTSCPPGGLWGRGSAFWRENWSKHPPFRTQNLDPLVEDPFKISRISGLPPSHFDPSTSLRALHSVQSGGTKAKSSKLQVFLLAAMIMMVASCTVRCLGGRQKLDSNPAALSSDNTEY